MMISETAFHIPCFPHSSCRADGVISVLATLKLTGDSCCSDALRPQFGWRGMAAGSQNPPVGGGGGAPRGKKDFWGKIFFFFFFFFYRFFFELPPRYSQPKYG